MLARVQGGDESRVDGRCQGQNQHRHAQHETVWLLGSDGRQCQHVDHIGTTGDSVVSVGRSREWEEAEGQAVAAVRSITSGDWRGKLYSLSRGTGRLSAQDSLIGSGRGSSP